MEKNIIIPESQAIIPLEIRQFLDLRKGDMLRFRIDNDKVTLDKAASAEDKAYLKLAEESLAVEWLSDEDEEAFKNW